MPALPLPWHALVCALNLGGFLCLALAGEREGALLLHRVPGPKTRTALRLLGWLLLATALAVCAARWHAGFGTVLWFGWLTVAAVALVFAIPCWPWRKRAARRAGRQRPDAPPAAAAPAGRAWRIRAWRAVLALLLASLPLAFGWSLHHAAV